ncbi:MAG: type I-E CRISPR-associated protein Cas5/CasD, partial [Haloechinothrix sp.]
GMRRTDKLTEFFGLSFGVRTDQPGKLVRDFQTARSLDGTRSMPLSYRYYLADAVFVAAIEGEDTLLRGLEQAVRRPRFPLYLGRRSCPPAGPISLGVHPETLHEVLRSTTWQAAAWHQRATRAPQVHLEMVTDAEPEDEHAEVIRDEPLSFDPARREYGWRSVVRERVEVPNSHATANEPAASHDPMAVLGG